MIDMGFLLYLTPIGYSIIQDMIAANIQVRENVGYCRNSDLFGYADHPNKFVICTNNIRNQGYNPYVYVNETIYHEATHVAQMCKGNQKVTRLIGIPKKQMPLPWNKLQDIKKSMLATKNKATADIEHEAYYLEDKPEKVQYYVRKYCF